MSYVIADPEIMTAAASDLARIGSNLSAAHLAVAAPTVAVIPAAADEVSASIAHLFSGYGQEYQALAGQAAAFHAQFAQNLTKSAASYSSAEDAIIALLQPLTASADQLVSTLAALPSEALSSLPPSILLLLHDLTLGPLLQNLLGGFGAPGLLPQIAVQIGVILEDVDPFPAVLRLINSLPLGPLTPPLLNLVNDLDILFFVPVTLPLLPWYFLYAYEIGKLPLG